MENNRIVREICYKANLIDYKKEVETIIMKIESSGFRVSCWDNSVNSVIEWGNKLIRIGMQDDTDDKFHVIWDMLHEYGHVLDGQPTSQSPNYQREVSAWKNATKILIQIPGLIGLKKEFNSYRKFCLDSYKSDA